MTDKAISLTLIALGVILACLVALSDDVLAGDADAGPAVVAPAEEPAPAVEPTPGEAATALIDAIKNGKTAAAIGFALVLLVAGMRKMGAKLIPWFETRLGGYAMVLLISVLSVVGASLIDGRDFGVWMVDAILSALMAAIAAHTVAKDVLSKSAVPGS